MTINTLKVFKNKTGSLFSLQKRYLNNAKRIFFIKGFKGARRGNHAHLKASQLFINIDTKVFVEIIYKNKKKSIFLSKAGEYFYCPPLSWIILKFEKKGHLAVISNRIYEKKDYINNYNKFLKL
jgi:hypothetical protein